MQKNNKVIALAGNPNVGKSTLFNSLTGLNQHTGNWTGKTVDLAYGQSKNKEYAFKFVDLPGIYSLMPSSKEEEVSRDFIAFENPSLTVIVCDACCLERNLNLVVQILEFTKKVVVCVNLITQANKRNIIIDLPKLGKLLKVPVIGICAKKKRNLNNLLMKIEKTITNDEQTIHLKLIYKSEIENAIKKIEKSIDSNYKLKRIIAIKLLINDYNFVNNADESILKNEEVLIARSNAIQYLNTVNISQQAINDLITSAPINMARQIANECVVVDETKEPAAHMIDKIITSKKYGIPIMILLISVVFWLTIVGSNYPTMLLSQGFANLEIKLLWLLNQIHTPLFITDILINGVYRVLAWVVAVMLPPMAIFFPLFTFLEDLGYLPRVAFNLDKQFKKCCACGKQALTMCMGFGCNAVGIVGCRIIDSKREHLIAIITNSIVPCNGRFPSIIALISIFLVVGTGISRGILSAFFLTTVIVFSVLMTFLCSYILSKTILKGEPSSFTLELPPYRAPQIGKIIIRSCIDRTLYVLGRAVIIAAPAGLLIYLLANIYIKNYSLLFYINSFFEPFGKLIGLDGVIITAFILGFPANEIVIPIILMSYMSDSTLTQVATLSSLQTILVSNGWTITTVICFIIFSLIHFPCSTTLLTIKKETKSLKWTFVSFIYPTLIGTSICFIVSSISRIILAL